MLSFQVESKELVLVYCYKVLLTLVAKFIVLYQSWSVKMMLACSCVCLRFRQLAFSAKAVTTVMFCHLLSAEFDDLGIL